MLTVAYLVCAAGVIPFHHHNHEKGESTAFSNPQDRFTLLTTAHSTANPKPEKCLEGCCSLASHFLGAASLDFTLPHLTLRAIYGAASAVLLTLLVCRRLFKPPRLLPLRCLT